jgi:hypothetical protein
MGKRKRNAVAEPEEEIVDQAEETDEEEEENGEKRTRKSSYSVRQILSLRAHESVGAEGIADIVQYAKHVAEQAGYLHREKMGSITVRDEEGEPVLDKDGEKQQVANPRYIVLTVETEDSMNKLSGVDGQRLPRDVAAKIREKLAQGLTLDELLAKLN